MFLDNLDTASMYIDCCYEMHFESCECVKMHLRREPRTSLGELRKLQHGAPPDPLAGFGGGERKGANGVGGEGKGRGKKMEGWERMERGREGRRRGGQSPEQIFWLGDR